MRTLLIALGVVVVVILAAVLLLWVYDLTYVPGGWFSYSSLSASPRVVPPFSVVVLQLLNALFIGVVAVAVLVFAYYLFKVRTPHEGARQRAENKVRMSDPILRDDIVILARTVSNQQKWDTLGAERSGAGWRSGELPEGPVVASSPFGGLSLHLLPAL